MIDAGFSENEVNDVIEAQGGIAGPARDVTGREMPKTQVGSAANTMNTIKRYGPIAGAMVGGAALPMVIEEAVPAAAAKYLPGPVRSGLGQAAGYFAGSVPSMVTGDVTPGEAAKQAAVVGATGGAVEAGGNILTRMLGSLGGVQQRAITQAFRTPTGTKTMFVNPGDEAEARLGQKIVQVSGPQQNLTPGRMTTQGILDDLQSQHKMVDMRPTMTVLDDHIAALEKGGIGKSNIALRNLRKIRSDLALKYLDQGVAPQDIMGAPQVGVYGEQLSGPQVIGRTTGKSPRVAVTPQEADFINQQIQDEIGDAFGKPGGTATTRNLKSVSKVNTASFRTQTGTAESAARTQALMKAIEDLRGQISAKSPESFVRSVGDAIMTKGESGDQTALMALRAFDTTGKLERQITQLSSQREWTGSMSRIGHNVKFEFIRRLPRMVAKATGMLTKPAGLGAGAYQAFSQAMQPRPGAMENP